MIDIIIKSKTNEKVKNFISLMKSAKKRKESGLFIVEGKKTLLEIEDKLIKEIYISEGLYNDFDKAVLGKFKYNILSDELYSYISDTKNPQGISIVCRKPDYNFADIIDLKASLLVLEGINDPGNMGTIFRSAAASGIDGIIMDSACVDVYNLKCIRASMGNILKLPHIISDDIINDLEFLHDRGFVSYAAHLKGKLKYYDADYKGKTVFIIGNEAHGISEELADKCMNKVIIPMKNETESLNAAVAASILMFEFARQKDTV